MKPQGESSILHHLITDIVLKSVIWSRSALDSESEAIVQEALDDILTASNATVVVVAHRLSTIRNADMIAVVESGKIVEAGNHINLMAKKGKYFSLVEGQIGMKLPLEMTSIDAMEMTSIDAKRNQSKENSEVASMSTDMPLEIKSDRDFPGRLETPKTQKPVFGMLDIHFAYPSRPASKIFCGLGLEIKRGESVALVGPSGQGKSTLIQLIEAFYRPNKGQLEYYGDDIKGLNLPWYRNE